MDILVRCDELNVGADLTAAICAPDRNLDLKRRRQLRQRMQHLSRRISNELLIVTALETSASEVSP